MSEPVAKLSASDPDLMRFAANAADFGSLITDRWDLVVRAGKGLGHGAPACFIPSTAEIELDASELGKHDSDRLKKVGWSLGAIDLVRPTHRNIIPVTTGAFIHECSHSLYTLWPTLLADRLKGEPRQVVELALALEEGRHESRMRNRDPRHERFLRATFGAVILPGLKRIDDSDPYRLLHAIALCTYRNNWNELAKVCRDYAVHYALRSFTAAGGSTRKIITSDFVAPRITVASDKDESMLELARKWWGLLPDSAKDESKFGESSTSCHHEEGEESDGKGKGSGGFSDAMETFAKDFDREHSEEGKSAVAEATDSETSVGGAEASSKGKEVPGGLDGRGTGGDSGSGVTGYRSPRPEELATARKLARILQAAQMVTKVKAPKRLPPGRLRGKAALAWSRDRELGTASTAALFKGKIKGDSLPPIRIGIGLDVSGSMSGYCELSSSLGWTLAAASWDVNALVSACCYGHGVMPYAMVGKAFKRVKTLGARAGTEAVGSAIEFLDSQVELINGDGPRILVLISDGHYVDPYELEKGAKLATQFVRSGGFILYIGRGELELYNPRYARGWPSTSNPNVFTCASELPAVASALGRLVKRAYDCM